MKLSALTAICASVIMLGSCSSLKKTASQPAPAPTTAETTTTTTTEVTTIATSPLAGEWSIVEVSGKPVEINGENHPKLTLQPSETHPADISVIGFNGCNYINGTWTAKGTSLAPAGEFLTSLMLCQDAPYESAINVALNTVGGFTVVDDQNVTLTDVAGTPVMKLRKRNLSFLNGAWAVTSIEGQSVPASANVNIVIDIDECKVHGNAGCNILNGDITVNLDKGDGIEFKNLMTSRMMCPDIATEQAFLLALESVDNATAGTSLDRADLRNAAGQTIITLRRLSEAELQEIGGAE